jgi:hypothetical protein
VTCAQYVQSDRDGRRDHDDCGSRGEDRNQWTPNRWPICLVQ